MQGTSKPYHDWGVVFAVEVNIMLGADHPLGAVSCHAEDCGVSFSWWHREATTCQGWVSTLARHSHPVHPRRQTAAGPESSRRLPGSSRATWATTRVPARCLPITPSCSSSSLSLLRAAAAAEEGNPALQLLPSAAGMQEGEGAEPPAEQLKITKYFPNIIRFPCKQLP